MVSSLNNDTKTPQIQSLKGVQCNNLHNILNCKPDGVRFTSGKDIPKPKSKSNNIKNWVLGLGAVALTTIGIFFAVRKGKNLSSIKNMGKGFQKAEQELESVEQKVGQSINETVIKHKTIEEMIAYRNNLSETEKNSEEIIDISKDIFYEYMHGQKHKELIEEGNQLLKHFDDLAAGKLTPIKESKWIKQSISTEKFGILQEMATSYDKLGNPDKAYELLMQSLKLPRLDISYIIRGCEELVKIMGKTKKPEEAIKISKELLTDGDHIALTKGIAGFLGDLGHTKEAEKLNALVREKIKNGEYYQNTESRSAFIDNVINTLKSLNL